MTTIDIDKILRLIELSKTVKPYTPIDEDEDICDVRTEINHEFFLLCCEIVPRLFARCQNKAEWETTTQDPYDYSFTCTEHLSEMVTDDVININPVKKMGKCCYLASMLKDDYYTIISEEDEDK